MQIDDGDYGHYLVLGSKVWAAALKVDFRIIIISSVQRTATLRVASAYGILSKSANLVISGVIPNGLQASERKSIGD